MQNERHGDAGGEESIVKRTFLSIADAANQVDASCHTHRDEHVDDKLK